ncbi:1-acyl-sn-glycerol-3-phosphate acyltransferase [Nocardioides baekrokdamisoli]|uniref:1-acyl-sn-glycerol-3-phosphate acyltransferase n=1 Tax=Nocardioides baekrokdamisoli TaxID=1804624 RepID=A0A3G9IAS3_9ACTN|nr:1-acyl-sn-glycerol-3-phosphate acyltransferase [Nocardioides baekrokdamisoli]BBH15850.1 1-acyl-sn-glycerol-3-phosphate acyltransferase [Nocardioides baekrokdamisoli]
MRIRPAIARFLLRVTGWKLVGTLPPRGIFVGAPHTSNWDWVVMLLIVWSNRTQPQALIKQEFFSGPFGPILRATGGVPLDRANPGETVRALLKAAEGADEFQLTLAAEGTRSKGEYWKSGFYRIAQQTGLPIVLGFVDGPTRTLGVGPSIVPSGDVVADMDRIRAFYADKRGIRPENRTEPRLREEADRSL